MMPEMAADGGVLPFSERSLGVEFGHFRLAESLRQLFEIFPFFGRRRPETGFDLHCVGGLAVPQSLINTAVDCTPFVYFPTITRSRFGSSFARR
jgi:hypothetical protein